MMNGPDIWKGLESAPTFEQGTFFEAPGTFVVQVERVMLKPSQKSGLLFLVEFEILSSNVPTAGAGSRRTWIQKMTDLNVAFPAIKSWVYAALGVRASDSTDADKVAAIDSVIRGIMSVATSESNALRGAILNLDTTQTTTKKNEPFTRHNFAAFAYEASGLDRPDWSALMAQAAQAQAVPSAGWGAPAPLGAPPVWARNAPAAPVPPAVPAWGAPAPVPPAVPAWGAPAPMPPAAPAVPAWGAPRPPAPPPPAPPPPAPPAPAVPPGSQISPDGFYYLAPGSASWALIPR